MYKFSSIVNKPNKRDAFPALEHSKKGSFFSVFFQPKLTINQPNDIYEQEADAMADKVMRMPDSLVNNNSFFKPSTIQRKCAHCEEEEKTAQRKETNNDVTSSSTQTEDYINTLSGGKPLSKNERGFFEPRMGYDFSDVKIHTGADAAKSAQSINALAYTTGNNIVFNEGQFSPDTDNGKRLLGHELTHVVQQNSNNIVNRVMRDGPSDIPVRVRLPVVETAAMQFGGLGSHRSPLSASQISTATSIFGSSIIYSAVRIVTSSIIAAPTTLGNNIRIPPGYSLDNATLIHELTHIWQYQNRGAGYISDSLTHQLAGILGTGDRNAAYSYVIVPGRAFDHYTAEQQAMIVEDFYRQPAKQSDPEYLRLIAQVRSATPTLLTDLDRYSESLYGPTYRNDSIFNGSAGGSGGSDSRSGGTVPLVRLEF